MQVTFLFNSWDKWTWVPSQTIGDDYKHMDILADSLEANRDVMLGGQMWWDDSVNMLVSDEHIGAFQGWTAPMQANFILSMVASGFMCATHWVPHEVMSCQLGRLQGCSVPSRWYCAPERQFHSKPNLFARPSSPPHHHRNFVKAGCTKSLRMAVTFAWEMSFGMQVF